MKGQGKELEEPPAIKSQINKFNKRKGNTTGASNNGSSTALDQLHMSEKDINVSRIFQSVCSMVKFSLF